ncbi:NAD(P)-dependent oxidoreductase [Chloracidobacterium validum]|uniref:NAD(P)-dependent oxidoreductase n=1 Tax=Chloracidobacterium validum TaxID=2821543 RepID=A0ABX8BFD7_9BACT|nr:NAD(P)-dependent oxidoreductase [Chloracidobacterium validum]QUW04333.1 NAD(P)-dependent oxidoreductase [Chloracidobacterium validum]
MGEPIFLIIGGGGYVGARLAEDLAQVGHVLVTGRRRSAIRDRWLARHLGRITWQTYDAATDGTLPVEGDYVAVFNLATPSAAEAAAQPDAARHQALATVEAAVQLVATGRARRLLHFSTFHVYGAPSETAPRPWYRESDPPTPTHPYGVMHAACEAYLSAANLPNTIIVRPTNLIGAPAHLDLGPQQQLMFLDLCWQAVQHRVMTLRTDGLAYRDFLPLASALAGIHRLLSSECPPRQCHLAAGQAMPLRDLAERIRQVAAAQYGWEVTLAFGKHPDAFRHPFQVDITALHELGWSPAGGETLDAEIAATLASFNAMTPS